MRRGELDVELYAPDIRIDNVKGFPITGPYFGHDGVRQWLADLSEIIEDFALEIDEVVPLDDERVLTTQRLKGRFSHTGIEVDEPWASTTTFRDGLITRAQGFASRKQALRAATTESR
jgi:ketosteroid isomerase-like protein